MSEGPPSRPIIYVVAGLLKEGSRICITRRRHDVHQAGKWEFPGGKLEPGESALTGLKRELREELAVDVRQAQPFMQVRHAYPELDVLLDIWRVVGYRGTPRGREGQEMRWADVATLDPRDFPEADRPILRRLQLSPLYLVSDVRRFGEAEFAQRLERALQAGARFVQLREPQMDRTSYCAYARQLAGVCHRHGARLLINADPTWVEECRADGVHLNSARLRVLSRRPLAEDRWVAASCHDTVELQRAADAGVDFAVLGAVQPTASHRGGPVLGWERFAELCRTASLPVYAIGGMTAADRSRAITSGACGLAMISGVWGADDLEAVVRSLTLPS